ncbi:MAG: DUF4352 domain-containing protein [Actinomycetota bacterium]
MGFDLTRAPHPEDPPARTGSFLDGREDRPGTDEERMARYWTARPAVQAVKEPLEVERAPERDEELEGDVTLGIPERQPVRGLAVAGVILGGLAVVAMLAVLVVQMVANTRGGADVVPTASAGAPAGDSAGVIGQPVRLGPFALKVYGVRNVPASSQEIPDPGMRWVAVDVEVVNESGEGARVDMWSLFDLETADGSRYGPDVIGSVADYADGDLPPGLRLRGEVVFAIPEASEPASLRLTAPDRKTTALVRLD